jgi:hypothetical protein
VRFVLARADKAPSVREFRALSQIFRLEGLTPHLTLRVRPENLRGRLRILLALLDGQLE